MGLILPVSFKQSDIELYNWINNTGKKIFSVSSVCKKILMEKKIEWEISQSINKEELIKSNKNFKTIIANQSKEITKLSKFIKDEGLNKKLIDFDLDQKN